MKVFVGYDPREDIAYQVCKHSILSKQPNADVRPLIQKELRDAGWYARPVDKLASTEFTFTRFLVPELSEFKGWALFMDCDMILTVDIKELFDQADDRYAVMCVQHDYTPREGVKMDGQRQTVYPRKNWSSVMLINCGHPSNQALSKELVNDPSISGAYLHRFSWLKDEEIGELDHTWNYLVGVYDDIDVPKLIHYTEGGPWFENYRNCEFHKLWKKELYEMMDDMSQ
jgi:lipopolysaccharide biosynthesis glycosyltransferase